ncbi:MAG TPA: hypothetical protein P5032_06165 [Candidatus Competibacter sp.]|nr:hypothetical protein [Candidatus Competibacter sp.]
MPQLIGIIIVGYLLWVLVMAVTEFIIKYIAPIVGGVIIALIAIGIGYAIYHYLKNPAKRVVKSMSDKAEEKRQKYLLNKELNRKIKSEREAARAKAMLLSSQIYNKAKAALGDEKLNTELEEIKQQVEQKILQAKMEDIDAIIKRYKETISLIDNSACMSAEEKAKLYAEATNNCSIGTENA